MERLRYVFAGLALAGFIAALCVHVAALRGIDVAATHPRVWSLHVGVFIVFLPLVFVSRRMFGRKPTWRQLRATLPKWVIALCFGVMVYAFVNFFVAMRSLDGGSPQIRDGQYVMRDHGHVERVVSAQEYATAQATELRLFSGHWLALYFLSFAFFAFASPMSSPGGVPTDGAHP